MLLTGIKQEAGPGFYDAMEVQPAQQRANAAANHRRLIYELADKGWRVMHERGITNQRSRAPTNFAHELMTCQLMASFELGCRETGTRLITWSDILQSQNLPDTTRRSIKPYHIPVTVTIDGAPIRPMSLPMVRRSASADPSTGRQHISSALESRRIAAQSRSMRQIFSARRCSSSPGHASQ